MRPQLEQKHPSILGNGHNRTSKGVYRKTNGKTALKIKKKKSTHTRFSNFLYFRNKRSSFEKNEKNKSFLKSITFQRTSIQAKQISILVSTSESFHELAGFYLTF